MNQRLARGAVHADRFSKKGGGMLRQPAAVPAARLADQRVSMRPAVGAKLGKVVMARVLAIDVAVAAA